LVYGVRYERTEDEGAGPLNSIAATYQRDSAGNFLRTPAGALIKITTNALANAQLQYTERGARKETSYDGWYPSFNASYSLNDHMVVRAAYARTIGRPNLDEIIPTTTVTDPNGASSSRRATIVDGNLMPWTSDNFDLTFEVYDLKGATISASLFSKKISNFFATQESDITPEELEELGLPPEYTDYTVVRKTNGKKARVDGVELSYRQSLAFVPLIGRHMQAFANMTSMTLSGEEVDSFEEFSPHNMSAGISYAHGRIVAKFDMTHNGLVRRAPAAASTVQTTNAFTWRAPSNRYDFSLEYRLTKRFSIYYSGRNLTATPVRLLSGSKETLGYLRPANYQFTAANHSLGIKGRF
jgi:TonB-dependent receptor